MRKVQIVFGLALLVGVTSVVQAQPAPFVGFRDAPEDGAVTLLYDPSNGELVMLAPGMASDGNPLLTTVWDLFSAGSWFIPENVDPNFSGPFGGTPSADQMTRIEPAGLDVLPHGVGVYPVGLSIDDVLADLTVDGRITPRGSLFDAPSGGPYLSLSPEPSGILLMAFGLLGLIGLRRKQADRG